jgi:outer membrane protein assembly factor BamB
MAQERELVVVGVGGHVVALNATTGVERWRTKLKGADMVSVWDTGSRIHAATKGELFCLDASTGEVLWHNKLKGLGLGVVAFGSTSDVLAAAAVRAARAAAEAGA